MNALALKETKTGVYHGLRCPHCKSHRSRRAGLQTYICETCSQSFTVCEALQAIGKKEKP
jgi:transposase-like protein